MLIFCKTAGAFLESISSVNIKGKEIPLSLFKTHQSLENEGLFCFPVRWQHSASILVSSGASLLQGYEVTRSKKNPNPRSHYTRENMAGGWICPSKHADKQHQTLNCSRKMLRLHVCPYVIIYICEMKWQQHRRTSNHSPSETAFSFRLSYNKHRDT